MHCFILMGVAGCGKTSVGEALADVGLLNYIDGDALHPASNVEKMTSGIPLNDDDRHPWLQSIGAVFHEANEPLAIGCSALKRSYRDLICEHAQQKVGFVHLSAPQPVIAKRMAERTSHFMPVSLLDSQFADLEPLQTDECGTVIDIGKPFPDVVEAVTTYIQRTVEV